MFHRVALASQGDCGRLGALSKGRGLNLGSKWWENRDSFGEWGERERMLGKSYRGGQGGDPYCALARVIRPANEQA